MSVETLFDRQERIAWWDQARLSQARVMVVGAGALGNEVLKNLALVGVGNLFVVDFDIIEDSNLSRAVLFRRGDLEGRRKAEAAAERLRELGPDPNVNVRYLHGDVVWDLGAGLYRHQDLVIGCLDNIEARLAVNLNCWKAGIPWIDGGIYELSGSISVFDASPEQACYECSMDEDRYRQASQRYSCTGRVVKAHAEQGKIPTTQTTSAIIAALQTQEAIKLLHGLESLAGQRIVYHGHRENFVPAEDEITAITVVELAQNPHCLCHAEPKYGEVLELWWAKVNDTTARDLLNWAEGEVGLEEPSLELGREFAIAAECAFCGRRIELNRPVFRVLDTEVVCPECEVHCPRCGEVIRGQPDCPHCGQTDIAEPVLHTLRRIGEADAESWPYLDYCLQALGVPPAHVLALQGYTNEQKRSVGIELSGDVARLADIHPTGESDHSIGPGTPTR
jgi:molybdopterin/thiamine biosynthesis adenylyltransferase